MTKKKQHKFSKAIVVLAIAVGILITGVALRICWVTGDMPASTITALLAFWGGELLLLCLKRVIGDGGSGSGKTDDKTI